MEQINKLLIAIEDSEEDIYTIKRAFNSDNVQIPILHFSSGEEAVVYFTEREKLKDDLHIIVLLDINLPGLNGHDILKYIRTTKSSSKIPIIMLTSSISEADVDKSYYNGVNSFIKKDIEYEKFKNAILAIKKYWFFSNVYPY